MIKLWKVAVDRDTDSENQLELIFCTNPPTCIMHDARVAQVLEITKNND